MWIPPDTYWKQSIYSLASSLTKDSPKRRSNNPTQIRILLLADQKQWTEKLSISKSKPQVSAFTTFCTYLSSFHDQKSRFLGNLSCIMINVHFAKSYLAVIAESIDGLLISTILSDAILQFRRCQLRGLGPMTTNYCLHHYRVCLLSILSLKIFIWDRSCLT